MATIYRLIFSAYLIAACLVASASATTRIEVYQATVPLSDRSEAAQASAFQAALRIVLVRATGRRSAEEEAAFAPLYSNARRYVQQYQNAADNQLMVAFDGAAIERWLVQNAEPVWGRDRPATFVWVSLPSGAVLSTSDTSELKKAIDTAAMVRGIPLIWPGSDAALPGSNPTDVGHRLGADAILIGKAAGPTVSGGVHWTLQFQDRGSEVSGTAAEGVNRAADIFAQLYATSGALAPVDIEVAGVSDLRDYAGIQMYLEGLAPVSHVSVESLSGDIVRFRLMTRGGIETLQRAFSSGGRLQSLPTAGGGIQRFQLHH